MHDKQFSVLTRRDFIRRAACAAVGTGAMTSAISDLRLMNAAVAQSNITDYKALVCIFLQGGNDSNNLILPTLQSEYNNYASIRTPILALPQSAILPVNSLDGDGYTYGLHPGCPELQALFGEGKLAFLFNTGTLVYPVTRAQYLAGTNKPPQLFFPRRPADAMADFHSRPASDHRLGRALRGFAECGAARCGNFIDGFTRRRQHL